VELDEGVRLAVVGAGAFDDPLELAAVLRIDHDHHVAAPDRLSDKVGERHALTRRGGSDQQCRPRNSAAVDAGAFPLINRPG
jgi:hypothetical protein